MSNTEKTPKTRKPIILTIEGHLYDVANFAENHPGEGINSVYLEEFNNKTVDDEMDKYHGTNEPWEYLEEVWPKWVRALY